MRRYYIIKGSVPYFEQTVKSLNLRGTTLIDAVTGLDLKNHYGGSFSPVGTLLVPNNNYLSIVDSAHGRLGSLIEDVTTSDATIAVHNPTSLLEQHIEVRERDESATVEQCAESRNGVKGVRDFETGLKKIKESIIGQDAALESVAESLVYLSKSRRQKPFVMMLYGKSSLGKTETARAIADVYFNGNMIEKHLSMYETTAYADYLFGGRPNVDSLGYDLYQRLSNLVFLDEIDKCNPMFHAAFYSLFDSTTFIDSTYKVDISGLIIILTCNYLTPQDIQKNLGSPIYYRIDKFVPFADLSSAAIYEITQLEIHKQLEMLDATLSQEDVYRLASRMIKAKGENGRTIQTKIRIAIEQMLANKVAIAGFGDAHV